MRTFFITQSRLFSGAQVNLLALLNTIDLNKVYPYLCFNPQSGIDRYDIRQELLLLTLLLPVYKKENALLIGAAMCRLLRLLMKSRIELAYINAGTAESFLKFFLPVCRLLKLPVILHLHMYEDDENLRWVKADLADRLLFLRRPKI